MRTTEKNIRRLCASVPLWFFLLLATSLIFPTFAMAQTESAETQIALGPGDVIASLKNVETALKDNGVIPTTVSLSSTVVTSETQSTVPQLPDALGEQVDRTLDNAYAYLSRFARIQAAHQQYKWVPLGKKRKFNNGRLANFFPPDLLSRPVYGVSALRLTPSENVTISRVIVFSDKERIREYHIDRQVSIDLPSKNVVLLDIPTTITQVQLFLQPPIEKSVTTKIELGISTPPDIARCASQLCVHARALRESSPGACLTTIIEARELLESQKN